MGMITKKVMPFFHTRPFLERAKPAVMDTNRFRKVMTAVQQTELKKARIIVEEARTFLYAEMEKPMG